MDGLDLGATSSAMIGLGAGGQPTVVPADKFTYEGGRLTLKPSALARCFTLSTFDPAACGH